jgi:hypothetical protein
LFAVCETILVGSQLFAKHCAYAFNVLAKPLAKLFAKPFAKLFAVPFCQAFAKPFTQVFSKTIAQAIPKQCAYVHGLGVHQPGSPGSEEHSSDDDGTNDVLETWIIMEYCEKGSLERTVLQGRFRRADEQPEMVSRGMGLQVGLCGDEETLAHLLRGV